MGKGIHTLSAVDLIIHAGDINEGRMLEEFLQIAEQVIGPLLFLGPWLIAGSRGILSTAKT